MHADIPLLLFAKAPVPGQAKTRMHSVYTPDQAAIIAQRLLEMSIQNAQAHWQGSVHLCVWPNATHPFLQKMIAEYDLPYFVQDAGDLGHKMAMALRSKGWPAAVMGSDVPHCPPAVFKGAYAALQEGANVLGPCEDGGYYMLGLQQPMPELFVNMPWGTDQVLVKTQAKLASSSAEWCYMAELNDIDYPEDLAQLDILGGDLLY